MVSMRSSIAWRWSRPGIGGQQVGREKPPQQPDVGFKNIDLHVHVEGHLQWGMAMG